MFEKFPNARTKRCTWNSEEARHRGHCQGSIQHRAPAPRGRVALRSKWLVRDCIIARGAFSTGLQHPEVM